jgi:CHASE3 domain sensor protein
MKIRWKIISLFLVIATLVTTLPLTVFAEEIKSEIESKEVTEIYIKEVKLVQAKS